MGEVAGTGCSSTLVTWQLRPVWFGVQDTRGGDGWVTHLGCVQQALIVLVSIPGWVQWGWEAYLGSCSGVPRWHLCSRFLISLTLLVMAIRSHSGGGSSSMVAVGRC